ncbi:MAG: hypothetical protein ACREJU_19950 [Nitrospiraceae bacterium]
MMTALLVGCAAFRPDQATELDPEESTRQEGLKNLAAIAELQVSFPPSRSPSRPPISMTPDKSAPDHDHEKQVSRVVPQIPPVEYPPTSLSLFPSLKRESVQSQRLFSVPPPISQPHRYTPSPYPLNPSLVPPYTFFAPSGSAYPGSVRCAPDYLGGSRCAVTP